MWYVTNKETGNPVSKSFSTPADATDALEQAFDEDTHYVKEFSESKVKKIQAKIDKLEKSMDNLDKAKNKMPEDMYDYKWRLNKLNSLIYQDELTLAEGTPGKPSYEARLSLQDLKEQRKQLKSTKPFSYVSEESDSVFSNSSLKVYLNESDYKLVFPNDEDLVGNYIEESLVTSNSKTINEEVNNAVNIEEFNRIFEIFRVFPEFSYPVNLVYLPPVVATQFKVKSGIYIKSIILPKNKDLNLSLFHFFKASNIEVSDSQLGGYVSSGLNFDIFIMNSDALKDTSRVKSHRPGNLGKMKLFSTSNEKISFTTFGVNIVTDRSGVNSVKDQFKDFDKLNFVNSVNLGRGKFNLSFSFNKRLNCDNSDYEVIKELQRVDNSILDYLTSLGYRMAVTPSGFFGGGRAPLKYLDFSNYVKYKDEGSDWSNIENYYSDINSTSTFSDSLSSWISEAEKVRELIDSIPKEKFGDFISEVIMKYNLPEENEVGRWEPNSVEEKLAFDIISGISGDVLHYNSNGNTIGSVGRYTLSDYKRVADDILSISKEFSNKTFSDEMFDAVLMGDTRFFTDKTMCTVGEKYSLEGHEGECEITSMNNGMIKFLCQGEEHEYTESEFHEKIMSGEDKTYSNTSKDDLLGNMGFDMLLDGTLAEKSGVKFKTFTDTPDLSSNESEQLDIMDQLLS